MTKKPLALLIAGLLTLAVRHARGSGRPGFSGQCGQCGHAADPGAGLPSFHAFQRADRGGARGPQGAGGGGQRLVSRGLLLRAEGQDRFRPPVRTPDVPGLGESQGRVLQAVRTGRCHRPERHHLAGPHQLFRDGADDRARHGVMDGIGSHGPSARRHRPVAARRAARRGAEREAPGRKPALRSCQRAHPGRSLSRQSPVSPRHHRFDGRLERRLAGRRQAVVPQLLRRGQHGDRVVWRHHAGGSETEGRALFRRYRGRAAGAASAALGGCAHHLHPRQHDRQRRPDPHLSRVERARSWHPRREPARAGGGRTRWQQDLTALPAAGLPGQTRR